MPEDAAPASRESESAGAEVGEREPFSVSDRLALLASYVQPDDAFACPVCPSLTDAATNGSSSPSTTARRRWRSRSLRTGRRAAPSSAALFASDGDDADVHAEAPTVGIQLTVSGDDAVTVSAALTTRAGDDGRRQADALLLALVQHRRPIGAARLPPRAEDMMAGGRVPHRTVKGRPPPVLGSRRRRHP